MKLIDTHTHIYLKEFKADFEDMMQRAKNIGITDFVLPAIDSDHTEDMMNIASENIHLMMGLHPCSVKVETVEKELQEVERWFTNRKFVAVGEIGIDLHWDTTTKDLQIMAFERQIDLAEKYDLPIVIHSRKATGEVIQVLTQKMNPKLRGIFHCFGGSLEEANEIISLGFKLGIGGVVTFKNAGLDKTLEHIDLKHVVLETDAPYLSPAPFRGKRNEPAYLEHIVRRISDIKNATLEEVSRQTSENAKEVFSF